MHTFTVLFTLIILLAFFGADARVTFDGQKRDPENNSSYERRGGPLDSITGTNISFIRLDKDGKPYIVEKPAPNT
ncbi:uncharacterized protein EV154DRAFT_496931, partial [Mucor mucedo]|uniref:uncharacterized protein n=1 Tax=Mucor mucedo TaxID=29922 RepID=UPI00221F4DC9